MAKPVIEVQKLTKQIKKKLIVNQVSFTLDEGKTLALCGGNGAGKSTLLRMLVGITQPTVGRIQIYGLQWKKERKKFAEQIGYMPDDFQFSNGLSVDEMLTFWASLRNVNRVRVQEVLQLVGLSEVAKQRASILSKGMRQRLLFAQAILAKPAVLIMDEPTNGLDPQWLDTFIQLIQEMKRQNYTIIFSTHQLNVAEKLADQVIFLKEGIDVKQGTTEGFHKHYGENYLEKAFMD